MRERLHSVSRWVVLLSIVSTSVLGYASDQIFDEDSFAALLSDSIAEPEVRSLLAEKAVDVALNASNADAALAEALPDEIALVATPAIELAKPTVAQAGATLLGVDAVEESVESAARSVHRQTVNAVLADDESDVVLSALPVLVVVADGIAGDAGARAVVGLDLPEGASEIGLGSNSSPIWSAVRSLSIAAGLSALILLVSLVTYLATARSGHRIDALRHLGHTWARAGVVVLLVAWLLLLVVALAAVALLSPGEAITFSTISVGGVSVDGAMSLASVILRPLLSSARQSLIIGGVLIGASHLLSAGPVAVALRTSVRRLDGAVLRDSVLEVLPTHLRRTRLMIWLGLLVLLLAWPAITARVALTLIALAMVLLALLTLLSGRSDVVVNLRNFVGAPIVERNDRTERTERAGTVRRWMTWVSVVAAVLWPDFSSTSIVLLAVLISAAFAVTYRWEGLPVRIDEVTTADANAEVELWTTRKIALAAAALGVCVVVLLAGGDSIPEVSASELAAGEPHRCNGHIELCDLTLDQVALAGTHNSMSSSDLGWELANHEGAIPAQLDGGIRALLIDVQRWTVATDLDAFSSDPAARAIAEAALSGADAPEDGLWMCHSLCQLGGTPFRDFLGDLRAFVETNPDEVVVVVIQDEADATSIKRAIVDAGLVDFALAHEPGSPWPTLSEMITSGDRLVFLAENNADPGGWYQKAFEGNVSETGFAYAVIEDFECAANRGADDGELFMINHWVETGLPIPAEADSVNSREVLLDRIEECERARGRSPGIIAVNFWERGDLFTVVDELNGVSGPE